MAHGEDMELRKIVVVALFITASKAALALPSGEPILTPGEDFDQVYIDVANAGIERNIDRFSMSFSHQQKGTLSTSFDSATDSLYIAKGTQVRAFTFNQVATAMYPGNSTLQQQAIENFRDLATDRSGMLFYQERSDRATLPYTGTPGDCDLSPCLARWYNGYGREIRIDLFKPTPPGPDLTGWSPEVVAIDRANFERARQDACGDQTDAALGAGVGMAAALTTCSISEFGLPALACGASIGSVGLSLRTMSRKGKTCDSSYPGPGKW